MVTTEVLDRVLTVTAEVLDRVLTMITEVLGYHHIVHGAHSVSALSLLNQNIGVISFAGNHVRFHYLKTNENTYCTYTIMYHLFLPLPIHSTSLFSATIYLIHNKPALKRCYCELLC